MDEDDLDELLQAADMLEVRGLTRTPQQQDGGEDSPSKSSSLSFKSPDSARANKKSSETEFLEAVRKCQHVSLTICNAVFARTILEGKFVVSEAVVLLLLQLLLLLLLLIWSLFLQLLLLNKNCAVAGVDAVITTFVML